MRLIAAAAVILVALVVAPQTARAEFGVGLFVGQPLGVTFKADLKRSTALEILLGESSWRDNRGEYGHLTFLATPFRARGNSVIIPFRLGIGVAIYDDRGGNFGDDINIGVRAPFQVAFRFRNPLELYFELSLLFTFLDENDNRETVDLDGGVGLRFYF
jgi:hypothetical protein